MMALQGKSLGKDLSFLGTNQSNIFAFSSFSNSTMTEASAWASLQPPSSGSKLFTATRCIFPSVVSIFHAETCNPLFDKVLKFKRSPRNSFNIFGQ